MTAGYANQFPALRRSSLAVGAFRCSLRLRSISFSKHVSSLSKRDWAPAVAAVFANVPTRRQLS